VSKTISVQNNQNTADLSIGRASAGPQRRVYSTDSTLTNGTPRVEFFKELPFGE